MTKEGQLVWVEWSEPEVVKDLGGSIMRLEKFLERRGMAFVANGFGRLFSWRTHNACLVDFYFEEVVEDGLRPNTVKAGLRAFTIDLCYLFSLSELLRGSIITLSLGVRIVHMTVFAGNAG